MIMTALIEGMIWSILWIIYVYVIVKCFPWQMLHDYPEDIQKAATIEKPTDKQNRNSKIFSVIGSLIIFASLIIFGLMKYAGEQSSFLSVFIFIFIIAMTWNVVDLIIMDWLIICTLTPKWVVIEGTEGCRGYKDYMYHFKGFLIGCIYTTIIALIFAGIDYLILKLLVWGAARASGYATTAFSRLINASVSCFHDSCRILSINADWQVDRFF